MAQSAAKEEARLLLFLRTHQVRRDQDLEQCRAIDQWLAGQGIDGTWAASYTATERQQRNIVSAALRSRAMTATNCLSHNVIETRSSIGDNSWASSIDGTSVLVPGKSHPVSLAQLRAKAGRRVHTDQCRIFRTH